MDSKLKLKPLKNSNFSTRENWGREPQKLAIFQHNFETCEASTSSRDSTFSRLWTENKSQQILLGFQESKIKEPKINLLKMHPHIVFVQQISPPPSISPLFLSFDSPFFATKSIIPPPSPLFFLVSHCQSCPILTTKCACTHKLLSPFPPPFLPSFCHRRRCRFLSRCVPSYPGAYPSAPSPRGTGTLCALGVGGGMC